MQSGVNKFKALVEQQRDGISNNNFDDAFDLDKDLTEERSMMMESNINQKCNNK